jgi:hypothetical protein
MATQNNVANGQLRSRDGGGERFGAATPSPLAMKQQQSLIDAASVGNTQVGAIDTLQNRIMQGVTANMRGSLEVGTTGASELLPQLASKFGVPAEVPEFTQRLYRHLKDKNMSMSDLLDSIDRSSYYTGEMGQLDAYQRQLAIAGIKTKSIPEKGVFADKVERFFQSNVPGSQVLFPEFINRTMRQAKLAPDILPYILATTTGIQAGEAYRTIYTNDVVDDRRLFRVDQTAEMSRTRLGVSEHLVRMFKYGRILEGSYEFFRRVTIDLFAIILARIALQTNLDKATTAIDVAINGDGNSNPAVNYNQSALDTGTTPTFKGYLAFALNFYPYQLTTLIGNASALTAFLTIQYPTINPLSVLSFLQGGQTIPQRVDMPQPLYNDVQLIYLPDAPSNMLIGLDRSFAIEMIMENGSNLVETDRIVQRQVNDVVISEINGFAKIFPEATKTWTLNA